MMGPEQNQFLIDILPLNDISINIQGKTDKQKAP